MKNNLNNSQQIGWYDQESDLFFCNDCFEKIKSIDKKEYRKVKREELREREEVSICNKCRRKFGLGKPMQIEIASLICGALSIAMVVEIFASIVFSLDAPFLLLAFPLSLAAIILGSFGKIRDYAKTGFVFGIIGFFLFLALFIFIVVLRIDGI